MSSSCACGTYRPAFVWRLLAMLALVSAPAGSQGESFRLDASPRVRFTLNDGWRFLPADQAGAQAGDFDDAQWKQLDLPHTWNASDFLEDGGGYRRGVSWYRRPLPLDSGLAGKRLFLYFEGVHQLADVFVNGKPACTHKGGYTAFSCEITGLVSPEAGARNTLAVRADSSHNEEIPPLDIGYCHYGGIYRDVWLVVTDPVHLEMLDHASPGVFITTPQASKESATVHVRGTVVNDGPAQRAIRVISLVLDSDSTVVSRMQSDVAVKPGEKAAFEQESQPIASPKLWSPDSPYLYKVETLVMDGQRVCDRVRNPLGFRWFKFDADQGFFLNGERFPLHGASRHQDHAGLGSALPNEIHRADLEWLKNMGGNFLRFAHYPQNPAAWEAADRLGLIVWQEIPIVSTASASEGFARTCRTMLTEMIRQTYNHPSAVLWGYMNEVFLNWNRMKNPPREFPQQVLELANQLDALARREDPNRVTVMAMDATTFYNECGLADVPMVAAWNIYSGWYSEGLEGFGRFLDNQHKKNPKRPIFVSEYGAGSDGRLHSLKPVRFDHSAEYMRMYHESHIRQIRERPWLAGTAIWNEFDFSQPGAGDSIPHMNQKGMLTFDRVPKDVYYLYKANWNPEPMVYIATREWLRRSGTRPDAPPGGGLQSVEQPVQVYGNLEEVELLLDGRSLGVHKPDDVKSAVWQVPLHDGWNYLEARGRRGSHEARDAVRVHFQYHAAALADPSVPFTELAVNVGSNCQYIDATGVIWEADQPYRKGGWGYVGGKDRFAMGGSRAFPEILGTPDDPLYQLFRHGLEAYRFDVPDGDYELELRFTEYAKEEPGARIFKVTFNGSPLIERLDLAAEYGVRRAASRTFQVRVSRGQGVSVGFEPIRGTPLLSAIRIRRLP